MEFFRGLARNVVIGQLDRSGFFGVHKQCSSEEKQTFNACMERAIQNKDAKHQLSEEVVNVCLAEGFSQCCPEIVKFYRFLAHCRPEISRNAELRKQFPHPLDSPERDAASSAVDSCFLRVIGADDLPTLRRWQSTGVAQPTRGL